MRSVFVFFLLCLPACSGSVVEKVIYESQHRFRRQVASLPPLYPFNCRVKVYENTMHKGDFLHTWKQVSKLNDCIGYCAQFRGRGQERCRAINYVINTGQCDLLSRATTDAKTEPVPKHIGWAKISHVDVVGCDNTNGPIPTPTPSSPSNECGRQLVPPKLDTPGKNRIINGADSVPHSWPWVVSISYFGKHICGGTLIPVLPGLDETDVVLTAAHCVKNQIVGALNVSNLAVTAGSHSRSKSEVGEQRAAVDTVHWHDYFTDDGLMNDIAMIKLKSPIKFTRTVAPLCLPTLREATPVDAVCVAAGWGRYIGNNDKTLADKLQQLRVPVVDAITCKSPAVWGGNVNTATMLCAGSMNGKQNVCSGDSGGALMCRVGGRWVQHGIVSFVYRQDCAAAKKPGVYTRVSMYRSWINEIVGKRSAVFKKAKRRMMGMN